MFFYFYFILLLAKKEKKKQKEEFAGPEINEPLLRSYDYGDDD